VQGFLFGNIVSKGKEREEEGGICGLTQHADGGRKNGILLDAGRRKRYTVIKVMGIQQRRSFPWASGWKASLPLRIQTLGKNGSRKPKSFGIS